MLLFFRPAWHHLELSHHLSLPFVLTTTLLCPSCVCIYAYLYFSLVKSIHSLSPTDFLLFLRNNAYVTLSSCLPSMSRHCLYYVLTFMTFLCCSCIHSRIHGVISRPVCIKSAYDFWWFKHPHCHPDTRISCHRNKVTHSFPTVLLYYCIILYLSTPPSSADIITFFFHPVSPTPSFSLPTSPSCHPHAFTRTVKLILYVLSFPRSYSVTITLIMNVRANPCHCTSLILSGYVALSEAMHSSDSHAEVTVLSWSSHSLLRVQAPVMVLSKHL